MAEKATVKENTPIVDGKYQSKNLLFLSEFMKKKGLTTIDLANAVGVTRQASHHWLKTDDMRLALADRLFRSLGYTIGFRLLYNGEVIADSTTVENSERKLNFLKIALQRRGITYAQAQKMSGFGEGTMNLYMKRDDIPMSRLMKLVESLDMVLNITLKRTDRIVPEENTSRQTVAFE